MPRELEDRLERVADTLPTPTSESRDRARSAALAALAQPPRRRRRLVFLVPAAAVTVAVGAVAILAAPWRDSPLVAEHALAALGDQPVLHVIVEQSSPRETVIDLASGGERPEAIRSELWYDDERDRLRGRLSWSGRPPHLEYLHSPEGIFTDHGVERDQPGPPRLDPAMEGFASGYRKALDSGEATVVGKEVVDGREAVILRFSLPPRRKAARPQAFEEVAVDADDYRPLRVRFGPLMSSRPWSEAPSVVEIETIARDPRDFERPPRGEPRPQWRIGVDERRLEPADAATALGRPAFWPGRTVAGVELAQIVLVRLTTTWTDRDVTEAPALMFQYATDRRTAHREGKPSLIMMERTLVGDEVVDLGVPPQPGGSIPRPGELRLTGFGKTDSGDPEMWFGGMQRDGVYISFESKKRDLIVAAAKAMVRLD
jgi:hypothetical protein